MLNYECKLNKIKIKGQAEMNNKESFGSNSTPANRWNSLSSHEASEFSPISSEELNQNRQEAYARGDEENFMKYQEELTKRESFMKDYNEVDMYAMGSDEFGLGENARQQIKDAEESQAIKDTISNWKKNLEARNQPSAIPESENIQVEEAEVQEPIKKETPEEKIRRYGEALGESEAQIQAKINKLNGVESKEVADDKSHEAKFYEALQNGATGSELAQILHKFHREGLEKSADTEKGQLELPEEYQAKYDAMRQLVSETQAKERAGNTEYSRTARAEAEKNKEKRGFMDKLRNSKFGKKTLSLLKKTAVVGAVGLAVFGIGKSAIDHANHDSNEAKTELVDKNQDAAEDSKNAFSEFLAGGDKTETAQNHELANNGRYDKENDTYWSQMNQKRNAEDIGNISTFGEKSPEQILEMHRNGSLEDNLSYQAQFMFVEEVAGKYFGISTSEAQDLYSRAQNGDQEAFKKINEGFKRMVADTDRFEWAGNVPANFNSFFGDMDENGHITMSTAYGLNYEDKMLNMVLKDGTTFSIDGTCTQLLIGQLVVELPQIQQFTPVEQPKVEQPKVEQPKVEQPKVEQPKVEQPKVEQPKVEQPKVEQPKVEQPKVEQPKTEEPAPKDRSKEAPGTYNGITPEGPGELTPPVSQEEQNNSVNPNTQSGENVDGVVADGAQPQQQEQVADVPVQYGGEQVVDQVVEQQLQQQQQAQEQANQNAEQSAKVDEVQLGDGQSLNLDEIREAQQNNNNGN